MTLQAERCVALEQHARVDGSMRIVAARATVAHRFVLEHKRTFLGRVALEAGVVRAHQRSATALLRISLVRVVAIDAAYLALEHWMGVRQVKLCAHFHVALETCFWRPARIEDCVGLAAGCNVLASGSVAGFATDIFGVLALGLQPGMRGSREIPRDLFVTFSAALGALEGGSRDAGRSHDGLGQRAARDHRDSKRYANQCEPYCLPGSALEPMG